jgi:hypothetical protein
MIQALLSKMQSYKKPRIPSGPRFGEQVNSWQGCRFINGNEMMETAVNTYVNKPGNEGPECIEAFKAE